MSNQHVFQLRFQSAADDDIGRTVSINTTLERAMQDADDRIPDQPISWTTTPNNRLEWTAPNPEDKTGMLVITKTSVNT